MTSLFIGTSGYSYKDWVGPVYPISTPAKDFLSFYQTLFSFTELNFSYYKQPDIRTIDRLVHMTKDTFTFTIKAHQSITHTMSNEYAAHIKSFKEGIEPLLQAGKLSAIVLQFPFSFHYTLQTRKYVASVCEQFENLPLAIEFRNNQWQRESVYEQLQKLAITYINVDEPVLPGLPTPSHRVTAPLSYIRFHGRNATQWWNGDNASRYNYLYSDTELLEWVEPIKQMMQQSTKIVMAFNNHWNGKAVTNARRMAEILESEGISF